MVKSIVDFFKNLPAKKCSKCGKQMEEQHECYGTVCNNCIDIQDL
ncbi:NADH pyrophosphatase NudC (nudix superfamily) [Oikeobacillus pervagus]|uniref:NADH pyrophosphatase NudC (Nudix superfamily) n=1 Tax=Oikeobacillus pervagus TaxID=1325931 RepID=A0AAJ1SXV2_9BACI|nr:protein YhfH [Oikeobacillus pervagus]MDQ0214774.1 NADH pyrophosphatase NudC (nudix superfamily) [Oikeobacillus pervagus]